MTSQVTTKAKAAVRLESAPSFEDWTVINLRHVTDALPIRKQVHKDEVNTIETTTPPATRMDMSRIKARYPEPWFGGKEEQPVDCFSVCTDSKKLGLPDNDLLEEVFISIL